MKSGGRSRKFESLGPLGSTTSIGEEPTSEESDAPSSTVATDDGSDGTDGQAAATAPETDADPVVRLPVNEGDGEATNWVARTFMDDTRVDLTWSSVDGADRYALYRMPTADVDYAAIADGVLDGATLIFEGTATETTDDDVPVDTFLTYVLVAEIDGAFTEPRWTEALTTPDTTPPTPITDLEATLTADGVRLTWSPSSDDLEFAAYAVTYEAEDGSLQYIGGGADETQTSFLDTEPRPGVNRYEVTAYDFHENSSTPAQVDIVVE